MPPLAKKVEVWFAWCMFVGGVGVCLEFLFVWSFLVVVFGSCYFGGVCKEWVYVERLNFFLWWIVLVGLC